jgi:hypothetical protein
MWVGAHMRGLWTAVWIVANSVPREYYTAMVNKPNRELTSTQRHVLEVFAAWLKKYGAPPSVRQLGAKLGVSGTSAHH